MNKSVAVSADNRHPSASIRLPTLLECGCRRIISLMTVEPSSTDPLHLLVLTKDAAG